jgi:putative proteasome-type protease
MRTFGVDGERQFVMLSAGNLGTTQSIVAQLERDMRDNAHESFLNVADIPAAADYLGRVSVAHQAKYQGGGVAFDVSFILGGQVRGTDPMVVLVYPQGNYITTSDDTQFLQIGESKYGKPILDRIITPSTSLETAAVCALVSMDSTMRSNITVGPPIELRIYHSESLAVEPCLRLSEDSPYLRELKKGWDDLIKQAFRQLPPIQWASARDPNSARDAISL